MGNYLTQVSVKSYCTSSGLRPDKTLREAFCINKRVNIKFIHGHGDGTLIIGDGSKLTLINL